MQWQIGMMELITIHLLPSEHYFHNQVVGQVQTKYQSIRPLDMNLAVDHLVE